ncbi:ABC transporter ATP-binding protein [Alphaproteobacteria bacterium]|jgi:ABC-type dipeptide/oligopeptide/nickel transport system ATPase component|nr:ABC transporter ATP-binding protein [Alphaproteobacteria bacterium]
MKNNAKKIISIKSLNMEINEKPILKNVSININQGEMVGLVGESGSGKSVTALSILKLIDDNVMFIKSGQILFMDEDLLTKSEKEIQKIRGKDISMIFQEPMTSLNPVFTIGDQINEVHFIHSGISKKKATELTIDLLDKVGIPYPEISHKKYPHQLSGGQRQRVMIAMALACKPKLLIADEPTTALDVIVQAQILNIINDLRKSLDMSVLLITHDLGVVQDFCDRVYVMYNGKILENSSIDQLFKNPQHQYTRDLLMTRPAVNEPGKRLPIIKGNYE